MATIFISCAFQDNPIAKSLESRLFAKGHTSKLPIGTSIAGDWRLKIARSLVGSDTLIAIITNTSPRSENVLGEIGAGRVLALMKGMLLMPILVGNLDIPSFVNDVYCFRLRSPTDSDLDELAQALHKAIVEDIRVAPRIFISHRHKDEPVAAALVELLEHAFYVEPRDIRCTSVQPYMLSPGERTSERLRADITGAELVIGILSRDTTESDYVLCELGASWGRDVPTFPVLAGGASPKDIPSPLDERHSVSLESEQSCLQLVDYVAARISLRRREGTTGKLAQCAQKLAQTARIVIPGRLWNEG